jgi:hypothetical protein
MIVEWFIVLCALNFISLIFVSMIILFYLKKRERVASDAAQKLLDKEEYRLNQILDEISNISTALYGDIEEKQKMLSDVMTEAQEKIDLLLKLTQGTHAPERSPVQKRGHEVLKKKVVCEVSEEKPMLAKPKANTQTVFEVIYGLADKGHSILEIAQIVNKPKGEVELILNLRHASRSYS